MEINKAELMRILESVRPGLASRQTHEQATHFIFTGRDVATFNDRLCITYPYRSDFKCSVKAEDFYKWLSIIDGEDMDMSLEDNAVIATSENHEAGFSCSLDDNHRVEKFIRRRNHDAKGEFDKLPEEFLEGINLCMFSCSSDISRSAMNCVYIEGKDLMSSDGMRLSWFTMSKEMPSCLIRARDLAELVKFPITQYLLTDKWAHFNTDEGVMFSAKLIIGSYADRRPYFKKAHEQETKTEIEFPKESIQKSLNATEIMVEEADMVDKHIRVEVEPDSIILSAQRSKGMSTGWTRSRIEIEYEGSPIEFKINPKFLHQILDRLTKFSVKTEQIMFTRDNFTHIIALTPEK
jgi:DNA polymerase III sliding clamp (beta) subunit (PCNA family)